MLSEGKKASGLVGVAATDLTGVDELSGKRLKAGKAVKNPVMSSGWSVPNPVQDSRKPRQ